MPGPRGTETYPIPRSMLRTLGQHFMTQKRTMVRIGTHSGTFHCDEALGCFLLRQTKQFKDAEIVRSRDPEVLKDLDVIIDVGGIYDPETHRYDHHQRGFTTVFGEGFNTKLSSAGLVYKHFGKEVLTSVLGRPLADAELQTIYLRVYKVFMEAVDGIDNGVPQYEAAGPAKYIIRTDLSARVGNLNTAWNEESTDAILYERFLKAVELTGSEFVSCVKYVADAWLPGRVYVQESLDQRLEVDPSGQIIRLNHYCPWKEHLYQVEEEMALPAKVLFVVYEDDREKKWRIQAVSESAGSFVNRRSMPAAWRGLRDEELSKVCGIPGGVFVHNGGFIGGNATYEGALAMAKLSLTLD